MADSSIEVCALPDLTGLSATMVDSSDDDSFDPPTPARRSVNRPPPSTRLEYSTIVITSDESGDDDDADTKTTQLNNCGTVTSNTGDTQSSVNDKIVDVLVDRVKKSSDSVEPVEVPYDISKRPTESMFKWDGTNDTSTNSSLKRLPQSPMESINKKSKIMMDEVVPCAVKVNSIVKQISGITIEFPLNPYPSQCAVMSAVSILLVIF